MSNARSEVRENRNIYLAFWERELGGVFFFTFYNYLQKVHWDKREQFSTGLLLYKNFVENRVLMMQGMSIVELLVMEKPP